MRLRGFHRVAVEDFRSLADKEKEQSENFVGGVERVWCRAAQRKAEWVR